MADYLNNADFLKALKDYHEVCELAKKEKRPEPKMPNYIGKCFLDIANHYSTIYKFRSYPFREDMVSYAVENCMLYYRNFDTVNRSNPFAYFSSCIYYAMARYIMKEKKQLYTKFKITEKFMLDNGGEVFEDVDGNVLQFEMYDNILEFIETYEDNKRKAKEKKNAKGLDKFILTPNLENDKIEDKDLAELIEYMEEFDETGDIG